MQLLQSVNSQSDFGKQINAMTPKRPYVANDISIDKWQTRFEQLLDKGKENIDSTSNGDGETFLPDCPTYYDEEDAFNMQEEPVDVLNGPITKEEVIKAVKSLKNGKSAGPDGIIGKLIKYSDGFCADFLVKLFNKKFDKVIYPDNWTESIKLPLYKKGNTTDPNNCRGISLSDITSKLYSVIINNRLHTWMDINDTVGEHQAGFRRDCSTIDYIFTLLATVQKQLVLNRKLYVAFIDFEKALNPVSRNLLWPILQKNKIKGNLFCAVRGMYATVLARVRSGNRLSDLIECNSGVKQGDVCSPVLFSFFINELALDIIREGKHGAIASPELI